MTPLDALAGPTIIVTCLLAIAWAVARYAYRRMMAERWATAAQCYVVEPPAAVRIVDRRPFNWAEHEATEPR